MNNHYTSTLHFLALIITLLLAACGGSGGGGGSVTYTIGGTVAGLTGTLVLQNNGGDNLSVTGGSFTFATAVASGSDYNVTILTQPDKQRCFVGTGVGAGTATANVSNITIACASQKGGAMQGIPLNLTPTVSTLAGTADRAADGIAAAARFNGPSAVVSDGANLYVVDRGNNKIRKVVIASGAVSTLAGSGAQGGADGIGAAATFYYPTGITVDSTGSNLYVADTFNHKIRQIVIATGAVSTLAGSGEIGAVDGTGTAATFKSPRGIVIDSTNTNLYVVDSENGKIRKIMIATAAVSSFTGTANTASATGATDGAGTTATFGNIPMGITTDGSNLYVVDWFNGKIRKIVLATQVVSSLTGTANTPSLQGANDGAATVATFLGPIGITTDGANLYVTDGSNNKIRVVALSNGATSSLTGAANTAGTVGFADGAGTTATFSFPYGITTSGGKLYVVDLSNTIRSITIASAEVTTLAGNANPAADGTGAAARFNQPQQVTSDGVNLYVADSLNHTIRKIVIASGAVSTLAGSGSSGVADGTGITAWFNTPRGITTDGSNVYVADTGNNKIRQIVIASGLVTTLAGGSGAPGAADGTGTAAAFNMPYAITTDGSNLYVADSGNNKIRKIVIASGAVSSLTGAANMAGAVGSADGAATAATFNWQIGRAHV